jgi:hypothetical protein
LAHFWEQSKTNTNNIVTSSDLIKQTHPIYQMQTF